ncbi:MAG: 50S ribosomal protein L11 methyltransferase [Gemmatimonadetes bacterium]|nr:50S ribosomal protein L11 methyltransferase [Gemmatimonadota bacterium]
MRWLVLEFSLPTDEAAAGLLVEELVTFSERGVEEKKLDGGNACVVAYFAAPSDSLADPLADPPETFPQEIRARLKEALGTEPTLLSYRWQEQEAWAELWRRGLAPRRVSPRLVVSPTWETPTLDPGQRLISLDPGMAFGTAEHPTTRGALRLLDPRLQIGARVADVGSGSGILSIAAALLGAESVLAVEMDAWSCEVARENVDRNGVSDRVRVLHAEVGPELFPDEPSFDLIAANIESGTLRRLLPGVRRCVREGGWVLLSGILLPEADAMVRFAAGFGLSLDEEDREGEWWTGAFRATALRAT